MTAAIAAARSSISIGVSLPSFRMNRFTSTPLGCNASNADVLESPFDFDGSILIGSKSTIQTSPRRSKGGSIAANIPPLKFLPLFTLLVMGQESFRLNLQDPPALLQGQIHKGATFDGGMRRLRFDPFSGHPLGLLAGNHPFGKCAKGSSGQPLRSLPLQWMGFARSPTQPVDIHAELPVIGFRIDAKVTKSVKKRLQAHPESQLQEQQVRKTDECSFRADFPISLPGRRQKGAAETECRFFRIDCSRDPENEVPELMCKVQPLSFPGDAASRYDCRRYRLPLFVYRGGGHAVEFLSGLNLQHVDSAVLKDAGHAGDGIDAKVPWATRI